MQRTLFILAACVLFAGVAGSAHAQFAFTSLTLGTPPNTITVDGPASGGGIFTFPTAGGTILTNAGVGALNLAGNFTTIGAHTLQFDLSGNTELSLPTSGALFANPMSAAGDIIIGGVSGAPTDLASSNVIGEVLTVSSTSGGLEWEPSSGGFANPMTSKGDIIYASATGTPATAAALGIGTSGYVLTVGLTGLPEWDLLPSGSGAVNSVSNTDGSLSISPTIGDVVAQINAGHANTWTAAQAIEPASAGAVALTLQGAPTSGDVLDIESNTGASTWLSVSFAGLTTATGGLTSSGTLTASGASGLALTNAAPTISLTDGAGVTITDGTNTLFSITDNGTTGTANANIINAATGYKIAGGTATAGHYLRGDGTNYSDGTIQPTDMPVFVASGASHAEGAVPDPGSTAGTTHYLREDGQWIVPPGSSGTVTSVSIGTLSNGISGSVSNSSTDPSINLGLGDITPNSVAASSTVSGTTLTASTASDGLTIGSGLNATTLSSAASGTAKAVNLPNASGNLALVASTTGAIVESDITNLTTDLASKGSGTVTSIGVTSANGVSGTSSGGATPSLTITLGAITPTTVAATSTVSGTTLTATTASDGLTIGSGLNTTTLSSAASGTAKAVNLPNASGNLALVAGTTGAIAESDVTNLTTDLASKGSGTVTNVSTGTLSNGITGSFATGTTTPVLTLALGAITPTSVTSQPSTDVVSAKVEQSTIGSPSADIFDVTASNGTTKYISVSNSGVTTIAGTMQGSVSGSAGSVPANSLTGTALASGVTTSSLTSFGTSIALGTPASGTLTNCTFPTLNQNTTGSAGSLANTAAAGLSAVTAINTNAGATSLLSATVGGTGNGFTAFTGPTTSTKTFTLPNVSSTILTSNAAVTVGQGGTGLGTLTLHGVVIGEAAANVGITSAGTAGQVLISGGASADPSWSTLTQGAGITITPGSGIITIAASAAAPAFSAITTGSNTTATMTVGSGGTLTYATGGIVDATAVETAQVSNSATYFPLLVSSSTNGNQAVDLDATGFGFNPSTHVLTLGVAASATGSIALGNSTGSTALTTIQGGPATTAETYSLPDTAISGNTLAYTTNPSGYPALTNAESYVGSTVTMTTAGTWYATGASISLSAGVWLVTADVTVDYASADQSYFSIQAVLGPGTSTPPSTVYTEGEESNRNDGTAADDQLVHISLSKIVSITSTTTVGLWANSSFISTHTAPTILATVADNAIGTDNATAIHAIRIK